MSGPISDSDNSTTFSVQGFKIEHGRLVPRPKEIAWSQNETVMLADARSAMMPGSAAFFVVVNDKTGKVSSVTIVHKFGQVRTISATT